jgi:N-acylneuraminate cytidylyltransferase
MVEKHSIVVALIPLRGGSKGIPNKNIRLMAGKPLCYWVLKAACEANCIDRVIVSTDSQLITDVVHELNLPVEVFARPAEFATDTSSTESVMLNVIGQIECDTLITIQATSPLLTADDLEKGYKKYCDETCSSLVSAVRVKRFFWSDYGYALNYNPSNRPRRQDFDGTLMENGAFYITSRHILEDGKCRLGGKIGYYEMSESTATEIDELKDWDIVESLLISQSNHLDLKKIKYLICDVDGTLTDGGMYYSENGEEMKKFNTKDGMGLRLLQEKTGIIPVIFSSEISLLVQARAKKLNIENCYLGLSNKKLYLDKFCNSKNISFDEIAYIGDDINDLECMKVSGFCACPADATSEILKVVNFISKKNGGDGAVREITQFIMEHI